MYNAPYQGVANDLAKYGRYGDSMLVHMNPIEVQMLSSLSPTGRLTDNPYTGQKEAFLPFLAPLLGSFLGNAVLGSTLGATAAGALGSAAATTLATGDLEQGIMSGITGFGIGSALGAAGNAAAQTAADAATQTAAQTATDAATQGVTQAITPDALNIQSLSAGANQALPTSAMATAPMESFLPMSQQLDVLSQGLQTPAISPASTAAVPTARDLTIGQRMTAPFTESGSFLKAMTEPSAFLPAYVGETGRMAREQELMGQGSMAEYEKEQEAARQKTLRQMGDVFNRVRQAYPGVGYAKGGQVEGYYNGGDIEEQARQAMLAQYQASALPVAEDVQLSLRGAQFVPPPASSYSALDVGGEGYLAGVAPEFQYFREPPPPPPAMIAPPAPGTIAGGDFGGFGGFGGFDGFGGGDFSGFDFSNIGGGYDGTGQAGQQFVTGYSRAEPNYRQPMVDDVGAGAIPKIDFSNLYGGIGAFNLPEDYQQQISAPVVPEVPTVSTEDRFFIPREMEPSYVVPEEPITSMFESYVPPAEMGRQERSPMMLADRTNDEFNPFAYTRDFEDQRYGGGMMYAEGGMTEGDMTDRSIVDMTVAAIRGEVENADEIISRFLDMYGPEAFAELRDRVLKEIVPGAQTKGMVEGEGGGQDDLVEGMIGTQRPVAVSPGEYIIPADVVSLAGGGYSGDGAKYFDGLIEDIRMKTMGKTEQIKPYRRSA